MIATKNDEYLNQTNKDVSKYNEMVEFINKFLCQFIKIWAK